MSGYWGATSGTALVFQKEEVKDFFTRYLLETYRKDGVTDEDIDSIDCMISDYGSSFCFLRSAHRQSLLEDFHSLESCVNEGSTAKHKKELFNCVEYCEEECSGGVLYPFKKPARGRFVDVKDGSYIIYTDNLHARWICLGTTGISQLKKSSKSSKKNSRHTCRMVLIGSLILDSFSVRRSHKTIF